MHHFSLGRQQNGGSQHGRPVVRNNPRTGHLQHAPIARRQFVRGDRQTASFEGGPRQSASSTGRRCVCGRRLSHSLRGVVGRSHLGRHSLRVDFLLEVINSSYFRPAEDLIVFILHETKPTKRFICCK